MRTVVSGRPVIGSRGDEQADESRDVAGGIEDGMDAVGLDRCGVEELACDDLGQGDHEVDGHHGPHHAPDAGVPFGKTGTCID